MGNQMASETQQPPTPSQDSAVGSQVLTAFQKKQLRTTWAILNKSAGPGGLGAVVFRKFLSSRPELRRVFAKAAAVDVFQREGGGGATLECHYRLLVDLLDAAVNGLDDLDGIAARCVEIGAAHAQLPQFDPSAWDAFGSTLVESLTQLDVIRKHRELVRAWRILASFLVDKIRQGYEARQRRPRPSTQSD